MTLPRWRLLTILLLGFVPAAAPAQPTHKPYKPVEVTLPGLVTDKTLDAFRNELVRIVQRKDRAALARVVAPRDFFWKGDFGALFDAKKSGFDNLAAALRLSDSDGRGWAALANFAAETTIGNGADRSGVHCAPAQPNYEDASLAGLTDATNTDVADWNYPRAAGAQVLAQPAPDAAVLETLGLTLVRVLGYEAKERGEPAWVRVATPGGKIGYLPPGTLVSPLADRLCFGKEAGGWRIVGYVGTGD